MTVHFRRRTPTRSEEVGSVAVSLLVGAGVAAVTWYLTRIFLSRERLGTDDPEAFLEAGPRRARLTRGAPSPTTDG